MVGEQVVPVDGGIADRAWAEVLVAEGVIEVGVRVDHPAHWFIPELAKIGRELGGLGRRCPRVHHQQPARPRTTQMLVSKDS